MFASYNSQVFLYVPRQIVVLLIGNSPRNFVPQYSKPLVLNKGVDNRIQFQFIDQNQKPTSVVDKVITCRVMNNSGTEVLLAKTLDLDLALTGLASLNVSPADIENINTQQGYYSLEIPIGDFDYPVFVDQNMGARGQMNIVNSILPSFVPSSAISIPTGQAFPNSSNANLSNTYSYFSSVINTEDNPVLTIQAKFEEYYGNILIEGSTQVDVDWYPIINDTDYANVDETRGYTIHGFHPFVRMNFVSNAGAVTSILAR